MSQKQASIKGNKVRDWQEMSVGRTTYKNQSQLIVKAGRGEKVNPAREGGGSQSSISEAIFPELLNEQHSKYDEFMSGADALVPEKILERPQRRLKALEDLREEILTATNEVNDKINTIFSRIKENVYSQHTDEGLLEVDFAEYEDCYFVDVAEVTKHFDSEVRRMQGELAKAEDDSQKLISQLDSFLKQNHQIVQDFLKTTH